MSGRHWAAALLLIPGLVLGAMSLWHAYNQRNGLLWQVPITGYDPRDLLSGHYLQFRYDWNFSTPPETSLCMEGVACALCTEEPGAVNPRVGLYPPPIDAAQCPSFIAGTLGAGGLFLINGDADSLTRYYIPENQAQILDALLRNQAPDSGRFVMGLRVNRNGDAFIDRLYLNGIPLEDWLQDQ